MATSVGIDPGVLHLGLAAKTDDDSVLVQELSFPKEGIDGVVGDYLRCTALCDDLYDWLLACIRPMATRLRVNTKRGKQLVNSPIITVEGPALARGGTRTVQVGFLHMAIYTALCRLRSLTLVVCPPMVLKKRVTGKGNASKEAMMEGILKRWFSGDIPSFGNQNIYEAYALARLGEEVVLGVPPSWMQGKVQVYTISEGSIHDITIR